MAEPHRRGGSFRIHIAYCFDRLLEAKLAQAYEILVPCRERPVGVRGKELNHENGRAFPPLFRERYVDLHTLFSATFGAVRKTLSKLRL